MASIKYDNVYIKDYYTVVGAKEAKSKLTGFNQVIDDYYFGCQTFESAEIKMQKTVVDNLLFRNNIKIDYLIGGDLINQICASTYNAKNFDFPFIGLYAACATFPLSIIMASNMIESKNAENVICVTSSHNLTAERQFRYPNEYGSLRPGTATITATGSVGAILSNERSKFKITSATIGKVIDKGVNDVNHMGSAMAPACADTLNSHLVDLNLKTKDYDLIVTGDLGKVGLKIMKEYYYQTYKVKLTNIIDAGSEIYNENQKNIYAGASGPCVLFLKLFCGILKNKKYKKILVLGTGALHSPTLVNQKMSIPAISHAISIEVLS